MDHPHDQELSLTEGEMKLFDQVEQVVKDAADQWEALEAGAQLRRTLIAGGVALAQLLHGVWVRFYAADPDVLSGPSWETFKNDVVDKLGVSRQTVTKYTELYHHVIRHHLKLRGKPVGALLLITPAAKADELEEKHWKALLAAPDKAAVREIIREVRGHVGPSQTAVKGILTPEGHLKAAMGDEPYAPFGYLTPQPTTKAGRIMRQRIIDAVGISEV